MFSKLLNKIGKGILAIAFVTAGVIGYQQLAFGAIQGAADFHSSLASGITTTATTMTLVSTSTPSGENLVQGRTYGFKLGGREFVSGTLSSGRQITSMTRGLSLLTGTTTGGIAETWGRGTSVEITDSPLLLQISNKVSGFEYFDNVLTYASGYSITAGSNQIPTATYVDTKANTASTSALATIQTTSGTYTGNNTFSGANTYSGTSNFTGVPTFSPTNMPVYSSHPTFSSNTQLIDKKYADDLSFAGVSNADDSTKGIIETAVTTEAAAGTSLGGSGARLVLGANIATSTSQVAQNSVVVTKTTGKIDPSFLNGSAENYTFAGQDSFTSTTTFSGSIVGIYNVGDGSDGNVTIASPTTLTRDMYYNNLIVTSTLTTGNYRIFVKGTISGAGTIQSNGTAGSNGSGNSAGSGGAGISGYFLTSKGGNGGSNGGCTNCAGVNGQAGEQATSTIEWNAAVAGGCGGNTAGGGACGNGTAGGAAGTQVATSTKFGQVAWQTYNGLDIAVSGNISGATQKIASAPGAGGGGGGSSGNAGGGGTAGGGGGGGAPGGVVFIVANEWAGTFTISSTGGNGGNGGNAQNTNPTGGGGGGGGGNGGVSVVVYVRKSWSGSYTLTGGTGGTAGTSNNATAVAGANGNAGNSFEIDVHNLLH